MRSRMIHDGRKTSFPCAKGLRFVCHKQVVLLFVIVCSPLLIGGGPKRVHGFVEEAAGGRSILTQPITILEHLVGIRQVMKGNNSDAFDELVLDKIPGMLGMQPCNKYGNWGQHKEFMLADRSNDNLARSTVEEMIENAGFKHERHEVISDDGYLTMLHRVINPRADRRKLKQPPVMMMHGGLVDSTVYLFASNVQHHPEKFPRSYREDGPITSSNRSLAFVLANNGHDVWLVGTRGSDKENSGRLSKFSARRMLYQMRNFRNMTLAARLVKLKQMHNYWAYTLDDLMDYEFPLQLNRILEVTGARNVSLFVFSFSTMFTLPALATKPEISDKVHTYVAMAPLINMKSMSLLNKYIFFMTRTLPIEYGTDVLSRFITSPIFSNLLRPIEEDVKGRYSLGKLAIVLFSGSSPQYRTHLELPVTGHALQSTSFMQAKHAAQQLHSGYFHRYDYGLLHNLAIYGQPHPPKFDISNIKVRDWMLISGETDNLACRSSVEEILRIVNPKPTIHLTMPQANHLDLVAGIDNDVVVNLPVLKWVDDHVLNATGTK